MGRGGGECWRRHPRLPPQEGKCESAHFSCWPGEPYTGMCVLLYLWYKCQHFCCCCCCCCCCCSFAQSIDWCVYFRTLIFACTGYTSKYVLAVGLMDHYTIVILIVLTSWYVRTYWYVLTCSRFDGLTYYSSSGRVLFRAGCTTDMLYRSLVTCIKCIPTDSFTTCTWQDARRGSPYDITHTLSCIILI